MGAVQKVLSKTVERAIWLGLLSTVIGAGLVVAGSDTKDPSNSALLTNFGAAIVTIGLVGILYDLLLRRLLVGEVLDAVGVHESARAFGLKKVSERSDLDLTALLMEARQVTFLPLDPLRWVDHDFETVRRCARSHALSVTLFIPAKDNPYVGLLAERIGRTFGQVEEMIDSVVTGKLGDVWDAEPVHKDATLSIYRFAGMPSTGLIMTDRLVAVEVGPLLRYKQLDREGYVIVAERSSTPMARWIESQLERETTDENLSQVDQRPKPPRPATANMTTGIAPVHEIEQEPNAAEPHSSIQGPPTSTGQARAGYDQPLDSAPDSS